MEKIMDLMIPLHTHAEIVYDHDPEQTVYREEHMYQLMREYGEMCINECAKVVSHLPYQEDEILAIKKQIR